VARAATASLTWEVANELDDVQLAARLFHHVAKETSRPQPDFELIHKELRRRGHTQSSLGRAPRAPPDGYGYSQFCHLYRTWAATPRRRDASEPQGRREALHRLPGHDIPIYRDDDLTLDFEAELFVAVLGSSSYTFATATRSQQLPDWIAAHVAAFEFLGAVPRFWCPTICAAGYQGESLRPDVNATYQEMAEHYGVVVIPRVPTSRATRPRSKWACRSSRLDHRSPAPLALHQSRACNDEIERLLTLITTSPSRSSRARAVRSSKRLTGRRFVHYERALRVRHVEEGPRQH